MSARRAASAVSNTFETAPRGTPARPAGRIQTNDDSNAAISEIKSVSAALRAEADYCTRFSLQPAKIDIFIGVNTRGQI